MNSSRCCTGFQILCPVVKVTTGGGGGGLYCARIGGTAEIATDHTSFAGDE